MYVMRLGLKSKWMAICFAVFTAIAAFGIDQAADTGCVIDLHALWSRAGINPGSGN